VPNSSGLKSPPAKRISTSNTASAAAPEARGSSGEPYRYRRGGNEPRPAGIPNKLPKALKWKEIEKARKNQEATPAGE
jgi:hypothetical protein